MATTTTTSPAASPSSIELDDARRWEELKAGIMEKFLNQKREIAFLKGERDEQRRELDEQRSELDALRHCLGSLAAKFYPLGRPEKSDKQAAEGEKSDKQVAEGEKSDKQAAEGEKSDKQAAEGNKSDKLPAEGEKSDKQPAEGEKSVEANVMDKGKGIVIEELDDDEPMSMDAEFCFETLEPMSIDDDVDDDEAEVEVSTDDDAEADAVVQMTEENFVENSLQLQPAALKNDDGFVYSTLEPEMYKKLLLERSNSSSLNSEAVQFESNMERMRSVCKILEGQNEELKSLQERSVHELDRSKKEVLTLRDECLKLRERSELLTLSIKEKDEARAELTADISKLKAKLDHEKQETSVFMDKNKKLIAENNRLMEENIKLTEKYNELTVKCNEPSLSNTMIDERAEHHIACRDASYEPSDSPIPSKAAWLLLKSKSAFLMYKNKKLIAENDKLTEENSKLTEKYNELREKCNEPRLSNTMIDETLASLRSDVSSLNEKLHLLKLETSELTEKNAQLNLANTRKDEELVILKANISTLNAKLEETSKLLSCTTSDSHDAGMLSASTMKSMSDQRVENQRDNVPNAEASVHLGAEVTTERVERPKPKRCAASKPCGSFHPYFLRSVTQSRGEPSVTQSRGEPRRYFLRSRAQKSETAVDEKHSVKRCASGNRNGGIETDRPVVKRRLNPPSQSFQVKGKERSLKRLSKSSVSDMQTKYVNHRTGTAGRSAAGEKSSRLKRSASREDDEDDTVVTKKRCLNTSSLSRGKGWEKASSPRSHLKGKSSPESELTDVGVDTGSARQCVRRSKRLRDRAKL